MVDKWNKWTNGNQNKLKPILTCKNMETNGKKVEKKGKGHPFQSVNSEPLDHRSRAKAAQTCNPPAIREPMTADVNVVEAC